MGADQPVAHRQRQTLYTPAERARREDERREAKEKEMESKKKLPLWMYAKRRLDACEHVAWLEVQGSRVSTGKATIAIRPDPERSRRTPVVAK